MLPAYVNSHWPLILDMGLIPFHLHLSPVCVCFWGESNCCQRFTERGAFSLVLEGALSSTLSKLCSSSNETSGVQLSFDIKEEGECRFPDTLRNHWASRKAWTEMWKSQKKKKNECHISNVLTFLGASKHQSAAHPIFVNFTTLWSSNYMLEYWDKGEMCLHAEEDNNGNVLAAEMHFQ